jgi:redox-sensitive bicupin YhaK (pirin superfamily)
VFLKLKNIMTKTTIERANDRGEANHGWLHSRFSFSFADYRNPNKVHFGLLRVLNDDEVAGGQGFGKHPHDNMEIVSIPLQGELEHKDSMGTSAVIKPGEVQIMSAGTGIVHSEFNHSKTEPVKFLQIWVFPKEINIKPRYDQKAFSVEDRKNKLQTVVSPNQGEGIWINQDAWFTRTDLTKDNSITYKLHKAGHGLFLFVLNGEVSLLNEKLSRRDSITIEGADSIDIKSGSDAELLFIEVPMS